MYDSLEQLQADVDEWVHAYNTERTHSGKHCFGKTPWKTLQESKHLAVAKYLDQTALTQLPENAIG